jgi:hypothetical protein
MTEGLLLVSTFVFDDLRPAYGALAMFALQVLLPLAAPIALLWSAVWRRVPPNRLGNLYFDKNGIRGAAIISCLVVIIALALIRSSSVPALGRLLLAAPAASCLLGATVGFCAGCCHYVFGRELLVRAGLLSKVQGACDVDLDR